jgi:hypothetical protein
MFTESQRLFYVIHQVHQTLLYIAVKCVECADIRMFAEFTGLLACVLNCTGGEGVLGSGSNDRGRELEVESNRGEEEMMKHKIG